MNAENLISKYLDGELSPDEDLFLRSAISSSKVIRDEFDNSLNLHLTLKEDANLIQTPDALYHETEDLILMKILSQSPPNVRKSKMPVIITLKRLTTVAAAFILFTVFKISDLQIPFYRINQDNSIFSQNITANKYNTANDNISDNKFKNNSSEKQNVNDGKSNLHKAIFNKSNSITDNNKIDDLAGNSINDPDDKINTAAEKTITTDKAPFTIPDNEKQQSISALLNNNVKNGSEIFNKNGTIKITEKKPYLPNSNNETNNAILNIKPVSNELKDIQISSFFGSDVARAGIDNDKKLVINFSQSVAYSISNKIRFGVETGYTEYDYHDKAMVNVPVASVANPGIIETLEKRMEVEPLVSVPLKFEQQKKLFWGAAFYEQTVIDVKNVSIHGRVGIGGSGDGPLGYGRLFARYEMFKGFSLTFGAEGRMFYATFPNLIEENNNLKSTATLVYGLQFKF